MGRRMRESHASARDVPADFAGGDDGLRSCVQCGLCLEVCPTYQLTGDANNSPRGRLRLWREEAEGRLPPDPWTDFYTAECVGCLACETACPGNVPYGRLLEEARHGMVAAAQRISDRGRRSCSGRLGRSERCVAGAGCGSGWCSPAARPSPRPRRPTLAGSCRNAVPPGLGWRF